jgi:hypothetical protein
LHHGEIPPGSRAGHRAKQEDGQMDEAAPPQAASGTTAGDEQALAALQWGWGEAYVITRDDNEYHAKRRDGLDGTITEETADALWAAIWEDYSLKPVPRDLP